MIITGRNSKMVENRAREIGITEVYQGYDNKLRKLKEITNELNLVTYIGDDINDIECMKAVKEAGGIVGCPFDAVEKVKRISDFVSQYNGGYGAVREYIDYLLEDRDR